jgi:hypothetical protein
MFYILNFLYLLSYSELPLAIVFIFILAYNKLYLPIVLAFFVVTVDCIFKYMNGMDFLYRFWQNLFLVSVLLSVIFGCEIYISRIKYEFMFSLVILIAIFRYWTMQDESYMVFKYLNENLIGLSLFSLAIQMGGRVLTLIILLLFSVKGLFILYSAFFRLTYGYLLLFIVVLAISYLLNAGVVNEIYGDYKNGNMTSGRSAVWEYVYMNYKFGFDYKYLLDDGYSNTESFLLNQLYSLSFVWVVTIPLSLYAIYKFSSSYILRLVVLIIFVFYPFPLIIFINNVFKFTNPTLLLSRRNGV